MFSYEITTSSIIFRVEWPSIKGSKEITIPKPGHMSEINLKSICTEVLTVCSRGAKLSGFSHIRNLKRVLHFCEAMKMDFPRPNSPAWSSFIYEHYIFHLSHPEKKLNTGDKTLKTLEGEWSDATILYKHLKHRKIIPKITIICNMKKLPSLDNAGTTEVLDSKEEALLSPKDFNEFWPKCYLIDKDLNSSTDKFLDNIQSELKTRSEGVIRACEAYWDRLMHCHSIGNAAIQAVSINEIEEVIDSGDFYRNGVYLADPDSQEGVKWFLAVADYYFNRTDELKYFAFHRMAKIPFFEKIFSSRKMFVRMSQRIRGLAGEYAAPTSNITETLQRLLGHVSVRDCAAASAILIAQNPKFNPHSLQNADYLSADDKPIHYFDSQLNALMWSVSKPRARARKTSALPPLSRKIYTDLVRATMKARLRLMLEGDVNYRKLFLATSDTWVGLCMSISITFNATTGLSLYSVLQAELESAGVAKSSFTLRRIRGTQGLLAFLKEGTYQSVANTLGNNIAVAKSHYIPEWLKRRWNIRILRIFQTKLVVLATKNKPWQLQASDFLTMDDLFIFVKNCTMAAETSDPISISLKKYAAELTEDTVNFVAKPLAFHQMALKLDAYSFAAIFMFAENYKANPHSHLDLSSGISADTIVTLSNVLHIAYTTTQENQYSNAILGNICGLSIPQFQHVYQQAVEIQQENSSKFRSVSTICS